MGGVKAGNGTAAVFRKNRPGGRRKPGLSQTRRDFRHNRLLPSAQAFPTVTRVNLPNAITFSRLVMTAAFVVAVSQRSHAGYGTGLILFVIAAISDFVDGWLARKMGQVTPLGKLMDPLADKILVSAAFVFLTEKTLCPVWVTALIIGREFMVTGLRQIAVEAGHVLAADRLGKWKTTFQLTFCIAGLVWLTVHNNGSLGQVGTFFRMLTQPVAEGGSMWILEGSMWIAVALTVISGANYMWSSRALLRAK
jgi:CDP-diacylglycerol---glycerol-3-phosphate 3-phosphatidyltransferase